jgi:hypothetical protein
MDTNNKKTFLVIILILLLMSLLVNCWLTYQLVSATKINQVQAVNTKVLTFTGMFVKDVLMATQDIDFEKRLELETTVRGLNNQDIFSQWQKFTKAVTKEDASIEAKLLLDLLIKSIKN